MSAESATSWSGSLAAGEPALEQRGESAAELVAAMAEVRAGAGSMVRVLELFRVALVWVEVDRDDHGVRPVQAQGLRWFAVFTSRHRLAWCAHLSGRGETEIAHGTLSGAEVLDRCLPVFPRGTGVLVDACQEHVLALPPVTGIVDEELAVDSAGTS